MSAGSTVGAGHGSASAVLGFLERLRNSQAVGSENLVQEDSGHSRELDGQFFGMLDILNVVSVYTRFWLGH